MLATRQPPASHGWLVFTFLVALLLTASLAGAQIVSPAFINLDPSAACSGGSDTVNDVCVTLPENATCDVVDVFLLFDDTGSFSENTRVVSGVFQNIVMDLESDLPNADFAFGVGRFEDFGGPGADFGGRDPRGRPFFLNQALLETTGANFDSLLAAGLSATGEGPADGGDGAESAIEALFQTATGLGFNGNPDTNTSVLDSGLAGAPETWQNPGNSGDVPNFVSYVGAKDGELGGAGWRENSCLRLVILATDVCSVAPFEGDADGSIPATIEGAGGSEPSSAISCVGGLRFGETRFGFVSDTESRTKNSVSGSVVAPVGAATVPETVRALNDLGIRVIGLGPGAAPTNSTSPSNDPSTFLSTIARLTGAVDAAGEPLVFDLGSGPADIRQAIVNAVKTSAQAPIDIALVPDPELPGLTVIPNPPVRENIRPGEEACFSVTFEGDDPFEGGSLGLTFVDTGSNSDLAMKVPATLKCPQCFDLVTRSLFCDVEDTGVTSGFEWTFILRNRSGDKVEHLFFVDLPPGVTIQPQHLTFSPGLQNNQPTLVTVRIEGATPGMELDFRVTLHDAAIEECCAERVRLELPSCDCAQLRVDRNPSCFSPPFFFRPGPPWRYRLDLENLTVTPVDYLLLSPVSSTDFVTPVPPSDLVLDPNVLLLDTTLGTGDTTELIPVDIRGPAARPGEEACFRISTHDATFGKCCSIVKCLTIPDCFFGPVDFEELGGATLVRSGNAFIVSDIGSSGEDGVASVFGPAREFGVSFQDFSVDVPLPEGASLRFAATGTVGEEQIEVANLVATLIEGQVRVFPGRGAPSLAGVQILRDGEVVATSDGVAAVAAVDGDWPTMIVLIDNIDGLTNSRFTTQTEEKDLITSNNIAGIWSEPVAFELGEGGQVMGDEVRFLFEEPIPVDGLTRSELTAADIPTLVIKDVFLSPVELALP